MTTDLDPTHERPSALPDAAVPAAAVAPHAEEARILRRSVRRALVYPHLLRRGVALGGLGALGALSVLCSALLGGPDHVAPLALLGALLSTGLTLGVLLLAAGACASLALGRQGYGLACAAGAVLVAVLDQRWDTALADGPLGQDIVLLCALLLVVFVLRVTVTGRFFRHHRR